MKKSCFKGFASWMEYRGVDYIHPEWHMKDQVKKLF